MISRNACRILLSCLLVATLSSCTGFIFQPMKQHVYTPEAAGVSYEDIRIDVEPGISLHGWRMPASGESRGALLFLHGNGENISTHFANIHWLTWHGYDCYIFDYRGYGKSDGFAELDGAIRDALAMIAYVEEEVDESAHFIVMGHSLGGAFAIHAVAGSPLKQRVTSVITVEAFSDYRAVTRDVLSNSWLTWPLQWPVSLLIDNDYTPMDSVADISPVPLLVMHSRRDLMVPFYHAMRLYGAAGNPKQFIEIDSDHSHIFNAIGNRRLLLDYLDGLD